MLFFRDPQPSESSTRIASAGPTARREWANKKLVGDAPARADGAIRWWPTALLIERLPTRPDKESGILKLDEADGRYKIESKRLDYWRLP